MPIEDMDGTLDGVGDLTAASFAVDPILSGSVAGSGDLTATMIVWVALGGQSQGQGTVYDLLLEDLDGTLSGSGTVTGSLTKRLDLSGKVMGMGSLGESVPLPLQGFGNVVAFLDVVHAFDPVCPPVTTTCSCGQVVSTGPRSYVWGQEFAQGNLAVALCDAAGQPAAAHCITYALYWVTKGQRVLVGPKARVPLSQTFGTYYAVGTAGECGQPGQWCIVWTWTMRPGHAPQTAEECFWVKDQVLAQGACDIATPRVRKYGWGEC